MEEGFQQTLSLWEGQILADKYRVGQLLGVGGMGAVYAAHHLQFDVRVAIKCLRTSLLVDPAAATCFIREARAAIEMNNEHLARVFDVGTLVTGAPYIVMEYLDGVDLGNWLCERGPLAVGEAVDFVLQACEGLAEAHALGIVHRDLKPEHLFCVKRPDGRLLIKVIDFGIATSTSPSRVEGHAASDRERDGDRNRDAEQETDGVFNVITGTPRYMAPEQIATSPRPDPRSDIWALGVILYELLSQRTPFLGNTLAEVAIEIASDEPIPLREICPHVPDGLASVISGCLRRDPRHRHPDVAALAMALRPFGSARAHVSVDRTVDILGSAGLSAGEASTSMSEAMAASMSASMMAQTPIPVPIEIATSPLTPLPEPVSLPFLPPAPSMPLARRSSRQFAVPAVAAQNLENLEELQPRGGAGPEGRRERRPGVFALGGLVAFFAAGVLIMSLVWRRSAPLFEAMAQTPTALHPRPAKMAFVVPNSATEGARAPTFVQLPSPEPIAWNSVPSASVPRAGNTSRSATARSVQLASRGGLAAVRQRSPGFSPASPLPTAPATGEVGDRADVAISPPASAVSVEADCRPSFDFDEQGRRHFRADCAASRPGAARGAVGAASPTSTAAARPNPSCDPSFDLDELGRKHFKPECFLKAKR